MVSKFHELGMWNANGHHPASGPQLRKGEKNV